jgi:hypothetical protein
MKRLSYLLLAVFILFGSAAGIYAAGTVDGSMTDVTSRYKMVVFTWTADSAAATVPATANDDNIEGYIVRAVTDPGGTATASHTCDATCAANDELALTAHPFTAGDIVQSSVSESGMTADTDYYVCPATTGATANFFKLDDTDITCASILNLTAATIAGVLSNLGPTDNYDITITDAHGVDVMGGELNNRDAINSEQALPKIDAVYGGGIINETVTLNISNNSVNSATGTVTLYIDRGGR